MATRKINYHNKNSSGAIGLLDSLNRYLNNFPIDNHERICFEDIPLKDYLLESIVTQPETALHKCLRDIAMNEYCIWGYCETDLFEDPKDFRDFFNKSLGDMSLPIPAETISLSDQNLFDNRMRFYEYFKSGINNLVNSAFSIAWFNIDTLQKFNEKSAEIVRKLEKIHYQELEFDGRFPRKNFPEWLKKMIISRERGFCYHCKNATTAAMQSLETPHIDHIVPLALGGTNDATNFVLSCAKCNTKKGANNIALRDSFGWPNY